MKSLVMKIFPFSCHLVPLRAKYLSQHPILEHPQPTLCCSYSAFSCHWELPTANVGVDVYYGLCFMVRV